MISAQLIKSKFQPMSARARLMLATAVIAVTATACVGTGPMIRWVSKYESTQVKSMESVAIRVDAAGFTYSLGRENRLDGTALGLLIKYDSQGTQLNKLYFQASGDNHTNPEAMTLDPNGDLIIVGKAYDAKTWFIRKVDRATLATKWETTWSDGRGDQNAYTVSTGPSGNIYVAGTHDQAGTPRYAAVKFNGATGAVEWTDLQYCCSNGAILDRTRWDSTVVTSGGVEFFVVNHGGPHGTGSGPRDQEIRWYSADKSIAGRQEVDMDSRASRYQFLQHPDGYLLFAGNRENTAKLLRIDYGSTGVTGISTVFTFDKEFLFSSMTLDKNNAVYIAGEYGRRNDLNIYTAKLDESCKTPASPVNSMVCWDREFNVQYPFNINISFFGIPIIDSFSKESVKDIFVAGNLVYILSTSTVTNPVAELQNVTNLYGYSTDAGVATQRIEINASYTVGGQQAPLDDSNLMVFGNNKMFNPLEEAADPESYLFTHSIKLY